MTKPKLIYFDAPVSRGEECRLALHLAGIDFQDVRINPAAWPAMKEQMPAGPGIMAKLKRIPPEPPQPPIPGGRTRASRLVGLDKYAAVTQRQSINLRLLSGLCGHDTTPLEPFSPDDVAMLAIIARERFDSAHIAPRRQSLAALPETPTLESAGYLAASALSSLEDPSARLIALNALRRASPWLARAVAANVGEGSDAVHGCARRMLETPQTPETRRAKKKQRPPARDATRG